MGPKRANKAQKGTDGGKRARKGSVGDAGVDEGSKSSFRRKDEVSDGITEHQIASFSKNSAESGKGWLGLESLLAAAGAQAAQSSPPAQAGQAQAGQAQAGLQSVPDTVPKVNADLAALQLFLNQSAAGSGLASHIHPNILGSPPILHGLPTKSVGESATMGSVGDARLLLGRSNDPAAALQLGTVLQSQGFQSTPLLNPLGQAPYSNLALQQYLLQSAALSTPSTSTGMSSHARLQTLLSLEHPPRLAAPSHIQSSWVPLAAGGHHNAAVHVEARQKEQQLATAASPAGGLRPEKEESANALSQARSHGPSSDRY